jgi:hypothetical protein
MLWEEMKKRIETAMKNWEIMREDLSLKKEEDRKFLSGSYLVLSNRFGQIELKELIRDPKKIAYANPFLLKDGGNKGFFRLCRELGRLEARSRQLQDQAGKTDIAHQLEDLYKQFEAFDVSSLDFEDDLRAEIRFPTVRMSTIQELKKHPLANSEETEIREFSIRVVVSWKDC